MNIAALVAKCRSCNAVFSVADRGADRVAPPSRRPALPHGITIERGEPPLPEEGGSSAARREDELVIERRWLHPTVVFATLGAIVCDAFAIHLVWDLWGFADFRFLLLPVALADLRKRVRRGKHGWTRISWDVRAVTHDRVSLKLLGGIPDRAQAEYIEWCVEQHVGIVDDPSMNPL